MRLMTGPPPALRRRDIRLDNLALVPASLLPFKAEWQAVANSLPQGDMLIILPSTEIPLRKILQRVASQLEADGQRVATVEAKTFG